MNLFICKCKDDDIKEKKGIDLLNIKNLENSIKKEQNEINMKKYYNIETNNNEIIIDNLDDELEIIDYPYEKKQEKKVVSNPSHIQLIKSNIINKNNKLFNNNKIINIKEIKKKSDLNSSSLSNESLIIDDIDYLNDEDCLNIYKEETKKVKPIKLESKKNNNKKNIIKSPNNINKINTKKINIKNYITEVSTKDSKNKIFHNESFKSGTTEVSTLKKGNKNKNIRNQSIEKKEHLLINNRLNKNLVDYKEFKNLLNKTFEEFSKSNRRNFLSAKKSVKNYFKNKKILFNDNSIKDIKQKQTKEKNIKNDFNNKRINKRKVLFKKLNLNYVQIK